MSTVTSLSNVLGTRASGDHRMVTWLPDESSRLILLPENVAAWAVSGDSRDQKCVDEKSSIEIAIVQ